MWIGDSVFKFSHVSAFCVSCTLFYMGPYDLARGEGHTCHYHWPFFSTKQFYCWHTFVLEDFCSSLLLFFVDGKWQDVLELFLCKCQNIVTFQELWELVVPLFRILPMSMMQMIVWKERCIKAQICCNMHGSSSSGGEPTLAPFWICVFVQDTEVEMQSYAWIQPTLSPFLCLFSPILDITIIPTWIVTTVIVMFYYICTRIRVGLLKVKSHQEKTHCVRQ